MRETTGCLRFPVKSPRDALLPAEMLVQHLDRDIFVEQELTGEVDAAHRALAEEGVQAKFSAENTADELVFFESFLLSLPAARVRGYHERQKGEA